MTVCKLEYVKELYTFVEENTIPFPEKCNGIISLCNLVVDTKILAEEYVTSLLTAVIKNPTLVAKKLVNDTIEEFVDIQKCDYISQRGKEVENVFKLFLNNSFENSELVVRQLVDEKYGDIISHIFRESPYKEVVKIILALKSLVKDLSDDPLEMFRLFLFQKIADLVQFYDNSGQLYFYFIDEYTGKPVQKSAFPLDSSNKLDILMNLLPSLYLSMRSLCLTDIPSGILKMIGKEEFSKKNHWQLISECHFDLESLPLQIQIDTLHAVIDEMTESVECSNRSSLLFDNFSYLKNFVESINTDCYYSGMKRIIYLQSDDVLWALPESVKVISA